MQVEDWDSNYQRKDTPWDIGFPSTPLKEYIDLLPVTNLAILIPGCGNAHEASYLVEKGFQDLTLLDISPVLTAELTKRFKQHSGKLKIITGNFFDHQGSYDLILEQTFFCALEPELRTNYVQKMHGLLKEKGKLAGVLFNREFEGGPPFGGNIDEYLRLFSPYFHINKLEPCRNSIQPRSGSEVFIEFEKRES